MTVFNNPKQAVLGLGKTGLSVVKYLVKNGIEPIVIDSRANPPGLPVLRQQFPHIRYALGGFDSLSSLSTDWDLIISPGISLKEPLIASCLSRGNKVLGDIELFAHAADRPIIAITGSNGKSSVTTLVGEILKNAGKKIGMGGNLGIPALELLDPTVDYYLLELSSFQLETTQPLQPEVAAILNLSEDHMDRYLNADEYFTTKLSIYRTAKSKVANLDDDCLASRLQLDHQLITYGIQKQTADFTIKNGYCCYRTQPLFSVDQLKLKGTHHWMNALAAIAITRTLGIKIEPILKSISHFTGLPHRCQLVRTHHQVDWYNDSKGTNVGATKVALESLGTTITGKIILIAGGLGKGADFSPLTNPLIGYVKMVILIGKDAELIKQALEKQYHHFVFAESMQTAVTLADKYATPGDLVLLSPACASMDMFNDYEHRGRVFMEAVNQL